MRKLTILLIVLAMVGGCTTTSTTTPTSPPAVQQQASAQAKAYDALHKAGDVYSATTKSMGDLYKQKMISQAVWDKTVAYGRQFRAAYLVAVDILENGGVPSLDNLQTALDALVAFAQANKGN